MAHFYHNIKSIEFKVGFFTLACFLVLLFSYSWLNDWFLSNKYMTVQVLFDNIGSLEKGHSVFFRGVRVGKVSAIKITPDGVLVDLYVENNIALDNYVAIYVKDKDVMGAKMVDMVPSNRVVNNITNGVFLGRNTPGLTDMISQVNELLLFVDSIVRRFEDNGKIFEQLDRIITNADYSLSGVNTIISDINNSDLLAAFTEIKNLSSSIGNMVEDLSSDLNYTITKVDSLITYSTELVNSLQSNINNQESNFNKIFNDEELYNTLVNSTKELESLLNDIKANPKKYFKFSVF